MTTDRSTRRRENVGTGLIVVATAVSALAVLGYQAIASRTLGTDGFAPIAVLWTVMFLVYTVIQLPAEQHLTRALVVTRDPDALRRVRRDMIGAFAFGSALAVGFVILTLDRFFDSDSTFVLITLGIMVSRSLMAAGRGSLAGHRRFSGYAGSIAIEAVALIGGGVAAALFDASTPVFAAVLAIAPLATMLARPFASIEGQGEAPQLEAQPGSFLVWLIIATTASQLIIAGGPIAVSFVGGTAAAVSIYFTSFALLRGPVTSAYNLVARVLPDFTELAQSDDPTRLWKWAPRITTAGFVLALVGAAGSGLLLRPLIEVIYGEAFVPPQLAATLGGAGVGLGLGALFATQMYSASARGALLASGWGAGLALSIIVLIVLDLDPVDRVAAAFVVGEATGLLLLGLIFPVFVVSKSHRVDEGRT